MRWAGLGDTARMSDGTLDITAWVVAGVEGELVRAVLRDADEGRSWVFARGRSTEPSKSHVVAYQTLDGAKVDVLGRTADDEGRGAEIVVGPVSGRVPAAGAFLGVGDQCALAASLAGFVDAVLMGAVPSSP